MKYESVPTMTLPKIGFGTWRIGGDSYRDHSRDVRSLFALHSALESGYTHFDTAEIYAGGHSEELIGQAIRETKTERESVIITSKVHPRHLDYEDVLKSCEASLHRLKMDYLDLYLIHWPSARMKLAETFRALNKLVREGKVHHLGVSNFNLKLLKESQSLSETPIVTNQVPYSLTNRSYAKNGVLEYCQQNELILTAYSPVNEGGLKVDQVLRSVAEAHGVTPYQTALAWLVAQPRVIAIPMSFNPQHIKENFASVDIELTKEELKTLSKLW